MINRLKIVRVDSDYCDYLREFDSKVAYNKADKKLRPFIGILFEIDKIEYFAPLSSPKNKHKTMKNSIDFLKLKNGELGAVNFNNMIPVQKTNYTLVDLDSNPTTKQGMNYQKLLKEQLNWLNAHEHQLKGKALNLYELYNLGKLPTNIQARCCNFRLLEQKCMLYQF